MSFLQPPPSLGNQYVEDRVLRSYLARRLPAPMLTEVAPALEHMGELAGGELYRQQLAERRREPVLTQWDAWGRRVDEIELTPLWHRAEALAARQGLVAIPYEGAHGAWSRVHQFALVYLFMASTDVYSCPLAMSDGAARILRDAGNRELAARALPHLLSRDPASFWTSGQWMTETAGGSDVGRSETFARRHSDGTWRLHGRKWFTSATTAQMALTLARPEGNPPGSRGLALFYLETRDAAGRLAGIRIDRLKDKLGTRKVPTAEITLDGVPSTPVTGLGDGVRAIAPMLNLTRTWNAVSAVALMRRVVALARDYAARRETFGTLLAAKPLHTDTLAHLQAELEGAFHLTFRVVELIGRQEAGLAGGEEEAALRVLTPVTKLTTARQAVAVASEGIECFGGAGYVEDTGLPSVLRDAQVLPIWEGTTNVLALEALRSLARPGAPAALRALVEDALLPVRAERLLWAAGQARRTVDRVLSWVEQRAGEPAAFEAGARRAALSLGRALELALLARHGDEALRREGDARGAVAADLLGRAGVDLLRDEAPEALAALATDRPLAATPAGSDRPAGPVGLVGAGEERP